MFFHRCSYKNSCFSELDTTPVSLCQSNDLQLEFKKWRCYLKNVALDFVFSVLKLCPIQVVISPPLWIRLTMGKLLLVTYWAVPSKSYHFPLFWCMLCTATPDISSSSENINSKVRVSRLSFRFLWLRFYEEHTDLESYCMISKSHQHPGHSCFPNFE